MSIGMAVPQDTQLNSRLNYKAEMEKKQMEQTVIISMKEFKELIKAQLMLDNAIRYVKRKKYIDRDELAEILGFDFEEGEDV